MTNQDLSTMLRLTEEEVRQLTTLLEQAHRVVLLPHTAPDGDALGAMLGFLGTLRQIFPKAQIQAIAPDPIERYLAWMPSVTDVVVWSAEPGRAADLIAQADLLIHLDHNEVKRLRHAPLIEAVRASRARRIMIDHHLNPESGFDLVISRPGVSSTSELIYALVSQLGWAHVITPEVATLLLTGIVTDTGRLMYGCFYPEVFAHFGQLLALGADYPYIIDQLSYHGTLSQLRLQGYALHAKLEVFPELRTAVMMLSSEEMRSLGVSKGDTEGLVNLPLSVEGVEASCFIREDVDQVKLSMRSIGDLAVNEIARSGFGGGGHLNAAGAELRISPGSDECPMLMAKNIYLRELKAYLESRSNANG